MHAKKDYTSMHADVAKSDVLFESVRAVLIAEPELGVKAVVKRVAEADLTASSRDVREVIGLWRRKMS